MHVADALSRLSSDGAMPIPDLNVQIHEVCPQFSNEYLQKIQEKTLKDLELAALKEVVFNCWPSTIKQLPPVLHPYWNYQEELSIEDGLIMKRHRIIIPQVLQGDILAKLRAKHQGTEKTKLRAHTSVFWKNINKDIKDMTKSCKVFQELQPNQPREPLLQTEVPPRPWHTIGTDLFYLDENEYLLIPDYYTKYPFVRKIPKGQSTSQCVVDITKQIFSEHSIPQIMKSDNGPSLPLPSVHT